jgi:hypothetical protein
MEMETMGKMDKERKAVAQKEQEEDGATTMGRCQWRTSLGRPLRAAGF